MITSTTAKKTYTVAGLDDPYAIGFSYNWNPDGTPQIKVYKNKLSNTPLVYGVHYKITDDGLSILLLSGVNTGDRIDIIRDIPLVQLSDYVVGRIDPEQIERDVDNSVMRDQELNARVDLSIEIPLDHEARIQQCEVDIDNIEALIPNQATTENQLADKEFVNSSISTSTATFRGTYSSLAELEAVTADDNDYGFVISTDAVGNTVYNRYKYANSTWTFEYALNNSSFTAEQWAAINSGVTTTEVSKINNLPVFILSISADSSTGEISVSGSSSITSITVKKLFGGATIDGVATITGSSATFVPTTATDITIDDWTIEVR